MGELHAGDARPDHDRVLGDLRRRVGVAGGEHPLAVDGDEVGDAGPGAGADDHEVGGDLLEPGVGLDHDHRADSLKRPVPLITRTCCDSSPVMSDAVQAVLDRRHALAERVDVEVTLGRDSHRVRAVQLEQLAARRDQRLRRDAVPQVRGAADDVALDERDVGAERRGDARAGVARGTATQDDETSA